MKLTVKEWQHILDALANRAAELEEEGGVYNEKIASELYAIFMKIDNAEMN